MSTILKPDDDFIEIPDGFVIAEPNERDKDDGLNLILSELGVDSMSDIMLKVYRINDRGIEAHIFDCLPDAIDGMEDRLRQAYGKGDFKIKVFAATSSGGKAIKKHIKLSIDVPLETPITERDNSGDDFKSVMSEMMVTMQANQTAMMNNMREAQLESQNKTQEMMIAILSNKNDGEKQPTMLETMALLKSLTPDTKDPMVVFSEMMTMNREIKEEMTPEAPAQEGSMGQLIHGMTSLIDLAKNAPDKQGEQTLQTSKPTQPQNGKPNEQQNKQEDMNIIVKQKLKSHLNLLCAKAGEGKSVNLWANLTVDEIPEQFYPQLIDSLGDTDEAGYQNLHSINPVIETQKEWFIEFVKEIRAMFEDEPAQDDKPTSDLTIDNDSRHDSGNNNVKVTDNNSSVDKSEKPTTVKTD